LELIERQQHLNAHLTTNSNIQQSSNRNELSERVIALAWENARKDVDLDSLRQKLTDILINPSCVAPEISELRRFLDELQNCYDVVLVENEWLNEEL
jgi:hypothetical protein